MQHSNAFANETKKHCLGEWFFLIHFLKKKDQVSRVLSRMKACLKHSFNMCSEKLGEVFSRCIQEIPYPSGLKYGEINPVLI